MIAPPSAGSLMAASSPSLSSVPVFSTFSVNSSLASSVSDLNIHANSVYDWSNQENLDKWRGIFVHSLEKVLKQVHPSLIAQEDTLQYVESLILRLLAMLTAKPVPSSVSDIEERVSKTFPNPIDKWALAEAQQAVEKGRKKSSLVLPVDKVQPMLKEVLQCSKVDDQVTLYLVAVLEYISADILKLAGNYVKNIRHFDITCQDIKVAMCADKVLMDMFQQENHVVFDMEDTEEKKSQTYDEVVKDLILDEKQYLRDLHMITKVFREILQRDSLISQKDIDAIFSNVTDVTELTLTLISSLEDTVEMTEEGNVPAIGTCFEELAEAEEFDVYDKYARDILSPTCRQTLETFLPKQFISEALRSCGNGFREAVKFYLPKLLLGPIYHCFHYFNYIEVLRKLTPSKEDSDTLKQVSAMLTPLKNKLKHAVQNAGPAAKRKPGDIFSRSGTRVSRQQSLKKLAQLQQSIANWEGRDLVTHSSEIVCEGKLKVLDNRKRLVDRYVILCDDMIIVCKQNSGKRTSVSSSSSYEYRLREKHLIRRVDVLDRSDTITERHTFELAPRDQQKIIFKAETEEEKNSWMAALVMLNTKAMLERLLDVTLSNEEKKHPLRFPPKDKYLFAEENSPNNIVFEQKEKSTGVPLIKGATLVKLIEYLTYHVYADPMFTKTFLTTYRSFSNPHELLDLLIARFNIPEPEFSSDSESECSETGDKCNKMRITQDLKRFRKEYSQPIQFRVLNVLKHWVDQHFYDFEQDEFLLKKLTEFLSDLSGKSMRKWADTIIKIINRRKSNDDKDRDVKIIMDRSPPPVEIHIENPEEGWPEILTFHPIEIARQLTLLEFQYYRAVKPSELVDLAWTREDKDKRSPNLLRMVRHTTNFTRYIEKLIVETENIDERAALMHRVLEIMQVLQEYNNFNGVLAITSAFNSSAVHRLQHTKDKIPNNLIKALDEASAYIEDHFKLYWEKLRSINPPCVPFFGQYQTNILFLEEGNPDFLQNTNLINFTKRRKVAEIISEIQQYQNQPYCLSIVPTIKAFLEGIDPFPEFSSDKEITDYLWRKSIEIEPRSIESSQKKKLLEGKVKWKSLSLRSPGIKPKNLPGKSHPNPLPRIRHSNRILSSSSNHNSSSHVPTSTADNDPGAASDSPLTSPIFRNSPGSIPTTPLQSSFGTMSNSPRDFGMSDPIKVPVILPQPGQSTTSFSAGTTTNTLPPPNSIPPPLPPKPSRSFKPSSFSTGDFHHPPPPPPPMRSTSSSSTSPPPLPPRLHNHVASAPPPLSQHVIKHHHHVNTMSWRDHQHRLQPPSQPPPQPPSINSIPHIAKSWNGNTRDS